MKIRNNTDHKSNAAARNINSFIGLMIEIATASKQKKAESNQSTTTVNFLDKPVRHSSLLSSSIFDDPIMTTELIVLNSLHKSKNLLR